MHIYFKLKKFSELKIIICCILKHLFYIMNAFIYMNVIFSFIDCSKNKLMNDYNESIYFNLE